MAFLHVMYCEYPYLLLSGQTPSRLASPGRVPCTSVLHTVLLQLRQPGGPESGGAVINAVFVRCEYRFEQRALAEY